MKARLFEPADVPRIAVVLTDDISSAEARALAKGARAIGHERVIYLPTSLDIATVVRRAREAQADLHAEKAVKP